tara:strand:+ start:59 stop:538 length:480 start_codon:yes stop_codon:yes gene_type:complete
MPEVKVLSEEEQMIENLIQSKIKGLKEFCELYKGLGKTMKGLVEDHKDFKSFQKKVTKIGGKAGEKVSGGSSEGSGGSSDASGGSSEGSGAWWNEDAAKSYFEDNAKAGSAGVSKASFVAHVGVSKIKENKWAKFREGNLVQSNPVEKSPRNFLFCLKS